MKDACSRSTKSTRLSTDAWPPRLTENAWKLGSAERPKPRYQLKECSKVSKHEYSMVEMVMGRLVFTFCHSKKSVAMKGGFRGVEFDENVQRSFKLKEIEQVLVRWIKKIRDSSHMMKSLLPAIVEIKTVECLFNVAFLLGVCKGSGRRRLDENVCSLLERVDRLMFI